MHQGHSAAAAAGSGAICSLGLAAAAVPLARVFPAGVNLYDVASTEAHWACRRYTTVVITSLSPRPHVMVSDSVCNYYSNYSYPVSVMYSTLSVYCKSITTQNDAITIYGTWLQTPPAERCASQPHSSTVTESSPPHSRLPMLPQSTPQLHRSYSFPAALQQCGPHQPAAPSACPSPWSHLKLLGLAELLRAAARPLEALELALLVPDVVALKVGGVLSNKVGPLGAARAAKVAHLQEVREWEGGGGSEQEAVHVLDGVVGGRGMQ